MKAPLLIIACLAAISLSSCKSEIVWDCHADNIATLNANVRDVNETVTTEAEAETWCVDQGNLYDNLIEVQGCSCEMREL